MKWIPTERREWIRVAIGIVLLGLSFLWISLDDFRRAPKVVKWLAYDHVINEIRPFDFRVDFYGMTYEGRSGNTLDNLILIFGAEEKHILHFLRDVARASGKQDLVFYDLGANVGQHTMFMSRHAQEVHAFEPYPPVLQRLENNVAINRLGNVRVHPVGLGDRAGSIPFYEPEAGDSGTGSFVKKIDNSAKIVAGLPIVVGDAYIEKHGLRRPDLVKCDVEGYEKPVLAGFRQALEASRPVIVLEVTPGYPTSFADGADFVSAFPSGYRFAGFCKYDPEAGSYTLCPFDPPAQWTNRMVNLVAYPSEKVNAVFSGSGKSQEP